MTERQDEIDAAPVIPPSGPGRLLREARSAKGMSVRDVADALHLTAQTVEHMEADRYEQLPPATFVKGYLRSYAKLVDVKPYMVMAAFEQLGLEKEHQIVVREPVRTSPEFGGLAWGLILVVAVLVGAMFLYWNRGDVTSQPATAPAASQPAESAPAASAKPDAAAPAATTATTPTAEQPRQQEPAAAKPAAAAPEVKAQPRPEPVPPPQQTASAPAAPAEPQAQDATRAPASPAAAPTESAQAAPQAAPRHQSPALRRWCCISPVLPGWKSATPMAAACSTSWCRPPATGPCMACRRFHWWWALPVWCRRSSAASTMASRPIPGTFFAPRFRLNKRRLPLPNVDLRRPFLG